MINCLLPNVDGILVARSQATHKAHYAPLKSAHTTLYIARIYCWNEAKDEVSTSLAIIRKFIVYSLI